MTNDNNIPTLFEVRAKYAEYKKISDAEDKIKIYKETGGFIKNPFIDGAMWMKEEAEKKIKNLEDEVDFLKNFILQMTK
jgi:hypothetical protein